MYKIFLVEDDYSLSTVIKSQLKSWGNEVITVEDFQNVSVEFAKSNANLVILDIMLPFYNGYHWCSEIRKYSNVPVIFLSSASDNMNIVMAINMGADDFIAKPVDPLVLTAKVQAILRRTYELTDVNSIMEFHGAVLDINNCTFEYNGTKTELTKNEYRILKTLLENKGKNVSREKLMMSLWQDDCYVEENTLTVNVGRLRKKLESAGLKDVIATKSGMGYILKNDEK